MNNAEEKEEAEEQICERCGKEVDKLFECTSSRSEECERTWSGMYCQKCGETIKDGPHLYSFVCDWCLGSE